MCLCQQAAQFDTRQGPVMPGGWEGNRRSGVVRTSVVHPPVGHGVKKGDEHPAQAHMAHFTLHYRPGVCIIVITVTWSGGESVRGIPNGRGRNIPGGKCPDTARVSVVPQARRQYRRTSAARVRHNEQQRSRRHRIFNSGDEQCACASDYVTSGASCLHDDYVTDRYTVHSAPRAVI